MPSGLCHRSQNVLEKALVIAAWKEPMQIFSFMQDFLYLRYIPHPKIFCTADRWRSLFYWQIKFYTNAGGLAHPILYCCWHTEFVKEGFHIDIVYAFLSMCFFVKLVGLQSETKEPKFKKLGVL